MTGDARWYVACHHIHTGRMLRFGGVVILGKMGRTETDQGQAAVSQLMYRVLEVATGRYLSTSPEEDDGQEVGWEEEEKD